MTIDKSSFNLQRRNRIRSQSGFTMIELIVVLAILSVVVLLAAPRFIGKTSDAKEAHIANDISLMERELLNKIILEDFRVENLPLINTEELELALENETLYSKNGKILETEKISNNFRLLDKNLLENITSQLDGTFYITTENKVLYNKEYASTENTNEIYIASEEDFIDSYGFLTYVGEETALQLPDTLYGNPLTEYDFMFTAIYNDFAPELSATPVIKVATGNTPVTSMDSMFAFSKTNVLDLTDLETSSVIYMDYMFQGVSIDELDLSTFNTTNLERTSHMFESATIETLNLSSFDMSNVTETARMFYNANIDTVYVRTEEDANIMRSAAGTNESINFEIYPN